MTVFYAVHVTALGNVSQWLQDRPASQSTIRSLLNNGPQVLHFRRTHSTEAVRLIV